MRSLADNAHEVTLRRHHEPSCYDELCVDALRHQDDEAETWPARSTWKHTSVSLPITALLACSGRRCWRREVMQTWLMCCCSDSIDEAGPAFEEEDGDGQVPISPIPPRVGHRPDSGEHSAPKNAALH